MAKLGDLLIEAFQNDKPDMDKLRSVRLALNKMQGTTSALEAWMQPGGNVDANLFAMNSSGFSILPHEGASALGSGGSDPQSIPNATWTNVTFTATSGATKSYGLKMDLVSDPQRIYVTGLQRESIIAILGWTAWANNTTGQRGIRIIADDNSSRTVVHNAVDCTIGAGETQGPQVIHFRSLPSTSTYYYMQVYQSSGGALNATWRNLFVMRLR